jgi:hypothetical protein
MKGFIYIFRQLGTDFYKIGMTCNESVENRFQSFKTYAPNGAEITHIIKTADAYKCEKMLHNKYKEFRMSGEFFKFSDDQIREIKEIKDEYETKVFELFKAALYKYDINESNIDNVILNVLQLQSSKDKKNKFKNLISGLNDNFTFSEYLIVCEQNNISKTNAKTILSRNAKQFLTKTGRGSYAKM